MQLDKAILAYNLAQILRYTRGHKGLSQSSMAKLIGCSRTSYLRLERAQRELGYSEWISIRDNFEITDDNLVEGVVYQKQDSLIKIPQEYCASAYTKGRLLRLLINFFKHKLGSKAFEDFCASEKIDSLYFVNASNPINVRFSLRIFQELVRVGVLRTQGELLEFARFGLGINGHQVDVNSESGFERIIELASNIHLLEENNFYTIEDFNPQMNRLSLSFYPKEHVDLGLYANDALLGDFVGRWTSTYFQAFSKAKLRVDRLGSFKGRGSRYIYEFIAS